MNRLKSDPRSDRTGVKVISLLSGKGGVGKSMLTFNLGERLAAEGYRVLIVDADTACGNLHILANTHCSYSFVDFANGVRKLADSTCQITNLLDLLPSPSSVIIEEERPGFEVGLSDLIARIRLQAINYDLVLIDHPSGISSRITEIASNCDANLLVIAPELTSIADGYGLFKRLVSQSKTLDCRFLINRAESEAEAEHVAGKFLAITERFIGQTPDFAGFVLESQLIKTSIGRQLPIAAIEPQAKDIQSLKDISRRLVRSLQIHLQSQRVENSADINLRPAMADTRG